MQDLVAGISNMYNLMDGNLENKRCLVCDGRRDKVISLEVGICQFRVFMSRNSNYMQVSKKPVTGTTMLNYHLSQNIGFANLIVKQL